MYVEDIVCNVSVVFWDTVHNTWENSKTIAATDI